ncbi:MAG: AAA family ATPase [Thermoflexales bacterium]|nr:AAA family ATPase [Thermoflexales bacterium]
MTNTQALSAYLPHDRLHALARGQTLPDRVYGAALFADVSGFTPLAEALTQNLGERRGAEELTRQINAVHEALITEVERYDGSVIGFVGDAITCWFEEKHGGGTTPAEEEVIVQPATFRALAAAMAMQTAMTAFPQLAVKVAVTSGPARRFAVGDPDIQRLDALVGAPATRLATAEQLAGRGETLVDADLARHLGLDVHEWRTAETGELFAVITSQSALPDGVAHSPRAPLPQIDAETLKPWVLPFIFEREQGEHGLFLIELRPTVALFLRFSGIDYDGDEQAQVKLNTLVCQVQAVLAQHAGTLLQLTIGDKGSFLYATFGAPVQHEDDARRAVLAALDLRSACARLAVLSPVQIGLSRGVMRTGAYGGTTRRTYGVIGDEANVAARLMSKATPGEILISERVQKEVSDLFVILARPPLMLKGKAELTLAFAVNGSRHQRAIRLQEPKYARPMVGRRGELQTIESKLNLALRGKAQVIGIVAEAGMGKSRLVAEVIRLAHDKGFAGYGGSCQSDGINTPYLVWKSVWSAFFDLNPELPVRQQIVLMERELEALALSRLQAMPLLNSVLDLEMPDNDFTRTLEPQYRKSILQVMLEECLRRRAQTEPILIVLEDLHWIDALSYDLLEGLAKMLADSRLCFVLAYRPAQVTRLQTLRLATLTHFTQTELHELTPAEAEQALHAKLAQVYPAQGNGLPAELVAGLLARAQGNPFYIEELINYLHDRGLDPRNLADMNKIELPDSLHTLILSRIDQVSQSEKTTLRVASIIGRLFRAHWLTGYYPNLGDLSQVKANLDQLDRLDITPLDTPEPELAYLFKHIVTHEVTYESMPFATRAALHEQLARYLEQQIALGAIHESALLDTLVYHYTRSENQAKQRVYLKKAGEAAFSVNAFHTAADYFTRLLEITPENDPARSALALQLADARYRLSEFPAARAAIAQAQAAAMTEADRAAVLMWQGQLKNNLGDYAEAQANLAEAVPLARTSGDRLTLCHVLSVLGSNYLSLGKLAEAKAAQEESLELARALGDLPRELAALNRLGKLAMMQDNLAEAEQISTDILRRAVATGNRYRAMGALNNLGVIAANRKDLAASREYAQDALALAREIGAQNAIALFLINLAADDIELGQLAVARARLREGLTRALRLGALPSVEWAVMHFASLVHAEGQTGRALALVGLARSHPAWSKDLQRGWDETLAEWNLDPEVMEAGLAEGATLDWAATIQELLEG